MLEPVARRFYVDSCSALDAAVTARSVRHGNQPELNGAVAVARWSSSGDAGQRVLSRKDPRVSGLVAAALALHGLTIPRRTTGGWIVGVWYPRPPTFALSMQRGQRAACRSGPLWGSRGSPGFR